MGLGEGRKGLYRSGQDFRAQREKARSGGLVAGPKSSDDVRGGPKPKGVFSGNVREMSKSMDRNKVTEQPSNQKNYGKEAIRSIKPFRSPVG